MTSSPTDRQVTAGEVVQVTMPQMGVSVAEGTIIEWRKQPGDWIERDETICEISTDKVDTELPSPASGRVVRILVEANETVPVGTPLAELDPSAKPGEPHEAEGGGEPSEESRGRGGKRRARVAPNGGRAVDRSHVVSPVVQRIAAEHGIDVTKVKGTGVGGRVRKKDLVAYIEAGSDGAPADGQLGAGAEEAPRPAATAAEVPPRATPAERPLHIESPYRPEEPPGETRQPGEAPQPAAAPSGGRREPLSVMRRQIAEHMLRSRRTAAHCTTIAEVDMARVVERRGELRPAFEARGVPLTYLAFVARAAVAALQDHPVLNAALDGDELVYHDDVNLGIAVALDDGLIVPVVQRAQRLSLEGLAAAVADLSGRARSKKLSPDEVQGGTFTITNPGQFGTVLATPIINQPQVAILDLEAVVKRPVVVEAPGGDSIAIRPTTNLCLSFDHRALDGAEAARFLGTLKARLEQWAGDG